MSASEFMNVTLSPQFNWAQRRSLQPGPAVWKSPTRGTTVVLVLIILTVMQLSLTAAPKGLQGSHYTLSFYCKPGNKEPVSCCSKTTPLPSMFKKTLCSFSFVVPCDHCQKSNGCFNRLPTGTHAQSKLCCDTVNSPFAVVLIRFDVLPMVTLYDTVDRFLFFFLSTRLC